MKVSTPNIVRVQTQTNETTSVTSAKPSIARDQEVIENVMSGLGALVSWGYQPKFSATPQKIREAFKASGLDVEVPEISLNHGVRQGCTSFRQWKHATGVFRAEISNTAKDDLGAVRLTVSVQKRVKNGKKTDWICDDVNGETLTVLKDAQGVVSFEKSAVTPAGVRVQELVTHRLSHYTGLEMTRYVLKPLMMDNNCVKLIDVDGLYYLIESKMDLVKKIKIACDLIEGIRFRKRDLLANAENKEDMSETAQENLAERISSVTETLEAWSAKSKIRKSSSDALYNELEAIKMEAEVLADALGFGLKSINEAIDQANSRAVEMVTEKNEAYEGRVAPSEASTSRWKALLTDDRLVARDNGLEIFAMTIEEAIEGGIPASTARKPYYYRDGQIHARALAEIGYFATVENGEIVIQTL